jgi:hypothetical protein
VIYVDDASIPAEVKNGSVTHNSTWSHMWADTQEELHEFAVGKLGLLRSYFQPGTPIGGRPSAFWHYDLASGKRAQALALGAEPVDMRDGPRMMRERDARAAEAVRAVAGDSGTPRRVLVTGSRTWTDEAAISDALRPHFTPGAVLVSGACPEGADEIAERVWAGWGGHVEQHPADWTQHPRAAGFIRNGEMVQAGADVAVAAIEPCSDPKCTRAEPHGSHGGSHCAGLAEAAGIPVERLEVTGHRHRWELTARDEQTCRGCETVASRERDADGTWQTSYRPTLRAAAAERLTAAGVGHDDPALVNIRQWNRQAQARAGIPHANREATT